MDQATEVCDTCGVVKSEHEFLKHPFRDEGAPLGNLFGAGPARRRRQQAAPQDPSDSSPSVIEVLRSLPSDPVLRLALMDKGLLTPEDLTRAEIRIVQDSQAWEPEHEVGEQRQL